MRRCARARAQSTSTKIVSLDRPVAGCASGARRDVAGLGPPLPHPPGEPGAHAPRGRVARRSPSGPPNYRRAMTTVAELLAGARRGRPHRPALRGRGRGPGARSWPSARPGPACSAHCAGTGPFHVGVLLENVPEYLFLLGGAALAGATVVGINPTRRGAELARDIAPHRLPAHRHRRLPARRCSTGSTPASTRPGPVVRRPRLPAGHGARRRSRRDGPSGPAPFATGLDPATLVPAAVHVGVDRRAQGGAGEPGAHGRARPA